MQQTGSYFSDKGLNSQPLHWKHSLNYFTAREVPQDIL